MIDHSFAVTWMSDFEEFHNSLDQETTYTSNLTRSLSLVLDQFYADIKVTTTTCLVVVVVVVVVVMVVAVTLVVVVVVAVVLCLWCCHRSSALPLREFTRFI